MNEFSNSNQLKRNLGPAQLVALSSIKFDRALKLYPKPAIKKAAKFVETLGKCPPVLIDSERNLISGEIWLLAHRHLELPEIQAYFVEGLTSDQLKAYRIGLAKLPELGSWDNETLGALFKNLTSHDVGFDIELTGFDVPEIDILIGNTGQLRNEADPDALQADESAQR